MTWTDGLLAGAAALLIPAGALAQDGPPPLSAIEWLDEAPAAQPAAPEPPVAGEVRVPQIEVTPLGGATAGSVGLLPTSVTGLPPDLWARSEAADLTALWRSASTQPPPAIQALYHTLLLAEAEPPRGDADAHLRTRIAILRRFGAVEPALELMDRAGPARAGLLAEWFDLSLLHGRETEACTALRNAPAPMDDKAAQVYCAALLGDWSTAMLLFDVACALGEIRGQRAELLELFLDPELAETAAPPPPPRQPDPLEFRLYEAIGSPLPTRALPTVFAMADLRGTAGWKAEIEAAERLTRAGAVAPERLLGLYTRQQPAASGGVWDRVEAVQTLDEALEAGAAAGPALNIAWERMREAALELPFARLFGERLTDAELSGDAAVLAWRIALLSPDYESAAKTPPPGRAALLLAGLARGNPDPALAEDSVAEIIAAAFAQPPQPAPDHAALIAEDKLGEAILAAAVDFDRAGGDPGQMADALATLRAVGLEDVARRAALQALILGPDG